MISSLFWTLFFESLKLAVRISSVVVLARLISPNDYGLFAVLLIFISFATVFTDGCFGQLIIRARKVTTNLLKSLFLLNLILIVLICLGLYGFRHSISDFIGVPSFASFVPFVCVVFFFRVISMVPGALMQRYKKFYQLSMFEFYAYATGTIFIALPFAMLGAGVFSLILMYLTYELIRLILFSWKFGISYSDLSFARVDVASLRYIVGLQLSEFINVVALQVDNILVSKFWGLENLGLYSRVYYITSQPANIFGNSISKVVFANFSRYQDNQIKVCSHLFTGIILIFLVAAPFCMVGYGYREEIVEVVLGQAWLGAAESFGWLCLGIPVRVVHKLNAQVVKARGLIWQFVVINFIFVCTVFVGILLVRGDELGAVAWAVLQSYTLVATLSFLVAVRSLGPSWRELTALCMAMAIVSALLWVAWATHLCLLEATSGLLVLTIPFLVFVFGAILTTAVLKLNFENSALYRLVRPIVTLVSSVVYSAYMMIARRRTSDA